MAGKGKSRILLVVDVAIVSLNYRFTTEPTASEAIELHLLFLTGSILTDGVIGAGPDE